jgi:hypothetical protein
MDNQKKVVLAYPKNPKHSLGSFERDLFLRFNSINKQRVMEQKQR